MHMSSILAPSFSQPPLSRALNGVGLSKASQRAAREELHLLSIDVSKLSENVRSALQVSAEEVAAWSTLAARTGASLVVMVSDQAIDLYSTEHDRRRAFRAVMEGFAERVQLRHELGRLRTSERRGAMAARYLFERAAGLINGSGRPFLARMHAATSTASAHAALGPTLASLFRVAANVGLRVRLEATTSTSAFVLGELESLVAERIVDEELTGWQSQEAELCRAEDMAEVFKIEGEIEEHVSDLRAFADEPGSHVRIRAAGYLAGLAEIAPLSLRAAGQRR
ncbi:MAG: hypothetical protein ACOY0T_22390 [Myxococcota bacterium]